MVSRNVSKTSSAGIIVGIASSNSKENIERVIGEEISNIIDFFDCGISLNGKDKRLKIY